LPPCWRCIIATLSQAGIPLSGGGILHPKQRNRFQVKFVGLGNGTGINITRQLTQFSRPQVEFEEIQLHRYNSTAFVAGKHSFQPTSITLEDDLTGLASGAVQAQLERQQRLIGADGTNGQWLNTAPTASAYKFAMELQQLDGNELATEIWYMEGCWIVSADYGELDYTSGEAVTIQLSIRYDHARQQLNPSASGAYGVNATSGFLANGSFDATTA
jgi:hypothetical protein